MALDRSVLTGERVRPLGGSRPSALTARGQVMSIRLVEDSDHTERRGRAQAKE